MPVCRPGRINFPVLILFILILAVIPPVLLELRRAETPSGEGGRPTLYKITWKVSLENTGPRPVFVQARLLLPPKNTFSQSSRITGFYPPPESVLEDGWGNRAAVLNLGLKPKAGKIITVGLAVSTRSRSLRVGPPLEFATEGKAPFSDFEKKHLGNFPGLEPGAPEVKTAATREVSGEKAPFLRALLLYGYLTRNFRFDLEKPAGSVLSALRGRNLQCADAALLYASLCRSLGIPARYAGGILYEKDGGNLTRLHAWNMVWTPTYGWFPVDPTAGRLDRKSFFRSFAGLSDRYIQLWSAWPVPLSLAGKGAGENIKASTSYSIRRISGPEAGLPADGCSGKDIRTLAKLLPAGREKFLRPPGEDRFEAARRRVLGAYRRNKLAFLLPGLERDCRKRSDPESTYALALARILLRRYSDGYFLLRELTGRGLEFSTVLNTLGYLYLETGAWEDSEETLLNAIRKDAAVDAAWKNLVELYLLEEAWEKLALASERASGIFPKEAFFRGMNGFALMRLKRCSSALKPLRSAVRLDPGMGWYHALLGWALLESGERERGRAEIREGLRLRTGISHPGFYLKMLR